MINIILAEDHTVVREGIKVLLESEENIHIVGQAVSGKEVLDQLNGGSQPDLVLADLEMPGMDGFTLIRALTAQYPTIPLVTLTMVKDEEKVHQAIASGAKGYLLKTSDVEEMIYAFKRVLNGKTYICAELSHFYYEKSLASPYPILPDELNLAFNDREVELLSLVAQGLTNVEMSERLFLSKRTVEGQRQALIDKTGCKNTASLIKFAVQHGII